MDLLCRAISDPHRRSLLERLARCNGQTLNDLAEPMAITRQAVSKHLQVLEDASVVVALWRGNKKLHYINRFPLQDLANGWLAQFSEAQDERVQ